MTIESKQEIEPKLFLPEVGFTSYIYPFDILNKEDHDRKWKRLIDSTKAVGPIEIQYEPYFETGYWESMKSITSGIKTDLSIHAPTQDRDIASADHMERDWSLEEYKRSMDLTNSIGGKALIVHLTPQDDFNGREYQLERGLESFDRLTKYKKEKGYGFKTLVETLEYPKWPSDICETTKVLKTVKEIDPNVGFCVDVAHLWHNVTTLNPDPWGGFDFPGYLGIYLDVTEQIVPVERFHFGGAFVQEGINGGRHETHYFPGLSPKGKLCEDAVLFYNGKPEGFNGNWMEINPVLSVISKFSEKKFAETGKKPDMIIEIHEEDSGIQRFAAQTIRSQMEIVSANGR